MQDATVTKYLAWKPHTSIEMTAAFVAKRMKDWAIGYQLTFVIMKKENHEMIGMIDVRIKDHRADLGYVLAQKEWNNGYMTEAVKAMIAELFSHPAIYRVWATCDIENEHSVSVLKKAGLEYEGILKGWRLRPNISDVPRDVKSFALLKK